jgi:hypothetical protein
VEQFDSEWESSGNSNDPHPLISWREAIRLGDSLAQREGNMRYIRSFDNKFDNHGVRCDLHCVWVPATVNGKTCLLARWVDSRDDPQNQPKGSGSNHSADKEDTWPGTSSRAA